jgi:hypothetical protein
MHPVPILKCYCYLHGENSHSDRHPDVHRLRRYRLPQLYLLTMPKDPKGRKRPADVISNAVHVMRIATGEIIEPVDHRNPAAVALGKLGGAKGAAARSKALTSARKKAIARKAALARWKKGR